MDKCEGRQSDEKSRVACVAQVACAAQFACAALCEAPALCEVPASEALANSGELEPSETLGAVHAKETRIAWLCATPTTLIPARELSLPSLTPSVLRGRTGRPA